jgi:hypothetical protein
MCSSERGLWQSFGVLSRSFKMRDRVPTSTRSDLIKRIRNFGATCRRAVLMLHSPLGLHMLLVWHMCVVLKWKSPDAQWCDGGTNKFLAGTLIFGVQGFCFLTPESATILSLSSRPFWCYRCHWIAHFPGIIRDCSPKVEHLATMSSLSGLDGGTNITFLVGTLIVGVLDFCFSNPESATSLNFQASRYLSLLWYRILGG